MNVGILGLGLIGGSLARAYARMGIGYMPPRKTRTFWNLHSLQAPYTVDWMRQPFPAAI